MPPHILLTQWERILKIPELMNDEYVEFKTMKAMWLELNELKTKQQQIKCIYICTFTYLYNTYACRMKAGVLRTGSLNERFLL